MSNSENYSDESISSKGGGSSGNEADSEGVEVYDKDMTEILSLMKVFNLTCMNLKKKHLVLL